MNKTFNVAYHHIFRWLNIGCFDAKEYTNTNMDRFTCFVTLATKRIKLILSGKPEKSLAPEIYRRTQIVYLILICELIESLVFGVLDLTVYNLQLLGVVNLVFCFLCTIVLWNFRKHKNLELASWFSVSMIGLMLIVFIIIVHAKFSSLMWTSFFPLVAFYVLGLRRGLIICLSFFPIIIAIIMYGTIHWDDLNGTETLSNLIGASLFGCVFIYMYEFTKEIAIKQLEQKTAALQKALDEVQTLKGLIPICANCKKIRDDSGYWNQIETYIEKHSEAEFSHGMCEVCAEQLYGDTKWFQKIKKNKEMK